MISTSSLRISTVPGTSRIVAGVLTGIQSFLIPWIGALLFCILAYTVTAAAPMLGSVTWHDSAAAASTWWLTSLGAPVVNEAFNLSLPPLALTFGAALTLYRSLPKLGELSWWDAAIVTAGQWIIVIIAGLISVSGTTWWVALLGSAALTFLCIIMRGHETLLPALPQFYLDAWRLYVRPLLRTFAVISLLIAFLAFVLARQRITAINDYYLSSSINSLLFALFQLAYAPTFLIWVLAYISGAGFIVGLDSHFTVFGSVSQPLPAIPALGALPTPGFSGWYFLFVPIVAAFLIGMLRGRRLERPEHAFALALAATVVIMVIGAVLGFLAQGAIGPGTLSLVGPRPPRMVVAFLLTIGLPLILGTLARRDVRSFALENLIPQIPVRTGKKLTTPEPQPQPVDEQQPVDEPEQVAEPAAAPTPEPAPAPTPEPAPARTPSPENPSSDPTAG